MYPNGRGCDGPCACLRFGRRRALLALKGVKGNNITLRRCQHRRRRSPQRGLPPGEGRRPCPCCRFGVHEGWEAARHPEQARLEDGWRHVVARRLELRDRLQDPSIAVQELVHKILLVPAGELPSTTTVRRVKWCASRTSSMGRKRSGRSVARRQTVNRGSSNPKWRKFESFLDFIQSHLVSARF
jgi:hypothetical protein